MASTKPKGSNLGALYTGPIYDMVGKAHFTFQQVNDAQPQIIQIGKKLPGSKDHQIKVGDVVYLSLQFSASSAVDKNGQSISLTNPFPFEDFFKFKSESDDADLTVKYLGNNPPPFETQSTGSTSIFTVNLEYLVDFSNLNSGEKIINLYGYNKPRTNPQSGISSASDLSVDEVHLSRSEPFYLHQSILDKFQKNIANEVIDNSSIGLNSIGLNRDKVNFPSYLPVGLQPVNPYFTKDVALWEVIRDGTAALSFNSYSAFMDYIFCGGINPFGNTTIEGIYTTKLTNTNNHLSLPFNNVDAYRALKVATEAFVMATMQVSGVMQGNMLSDYNAYLQEFSTGIANPATIKILPYLALIRQKLPDLNFKFHGFDEAISAYLNDTRLTESCYGLIASKLQFPVFLELIWNYWHEESMMVQGITSIARRFQNIRGGGVIDPLANLEIGPLRPINNLMWGYIQDEQHRLTVRRRAYEYNHEYGISLQGTALQGMRMADSRSKFIEAFHTLMNLCMKFYHQYDDTTVVADGFPIMNALKEVHMILSEGAHNQYGDLPSTTRIEMLMQLYILARPEFREFLPTRQMVAYPEPWMDRVGVLNQVHNWTKTNVIHYRDLGVFGEQIILSIRWGAWSDVFDRNQAANWAIFWRAQIQNYMHAYRAVTGVDLTREDGVIDVQQPSIHLLRRLKEENRKVRI